MNPEDNSESKNPNETPLPPELEARVVAWVLGEASAFETAELERMCGEIPELAIFKRRIEAVHGLIGEAEQPVESSLRLSEERRTNLLKTLGAPATATAQDKIATLPQRRRIPTWAKWSGVLTSAAAAIIVVGITLSEPFNKKPRPDPSLTTLGPTPSDERSVAQYAPVPQEADLSTRLVAPVAAVKRAERKAEFDDSSRADRLRITFDAAPQSAAPAPAPASAPIQLGNRFSVDTLTASGGAGGGGLATEANAPKNEAAAFSVGGSFNVVGGTVADRGGTATLNTIPEANFKAAPGSAAGLEIVKMDPVTVEAERMGYSGAIMSQAMTSSVPLALKDQAAEVRNNLTVSHTAASADAFGAAQADTAKFTVTGSVTESAALSAPSGTGGRVVLDTDQTTAAGKPDASSTWGYANLPADTESRSRGRALVSEGQLVTDNSLVAPPAPSDNKETEVIKLSAFMVSTERDGQPRAIGTASEASKAAKVGPSPGRVASPPPAAVIAGRFQDALQKTAEPDLPVARPAAVIDEALRAEIATSTQAFSTFSLHVSDVSYRLARAALERGQRPEAGTIRPEEFYNAFDYGDPAPVAGEPVAARIEQAAHPFLQQRNLVRVALKVPATGRGAGQPLRLTVLLDTSGSMEREDRAASVRRAFDVLAGLLGPADRVTLIGFARTPRLLAERLPGNQAKQLNDIVRRTPAEGGTNLEEALKLAGEHARRDFTTGAQNRIVLLTDGAANLGNADPAQLATLVGALRQQGIAFDACGVGLDGLDDTVLEALTRKGDGRYYAINSPEEADAKFARQLAGAFRPAARDVKVQVRFNPARVRSYRLIGFEQHRLRAEDFRNDKIDAAELAAEEAAVALYQVEVIAEGEGELGEASVRFRRADNNEIIERKWTLSFAAQPPALTRATPSMQLAASAALLAEKLRGGAAAGPIRLNELAPVVNGLRTTYARDARVRDFIAMFAQARRVVGD